MIDHKTMSKAAYEAGYYPPVGEPKDPNPFTRDRYKSIPSCFKPFCKDCQLKEKCENNSAF